LSRCPGGSRNTVCALAKGLEADLAGAGETDERLIWELADLWFHSYLLLAVRGLESGDIKREPRAL